MNSPAIADTSRRLLCLQGVDAVSFLQGLTTNDMLKLESTGALYSAMLSPQGKWQHDFFAFTREGRIYLDVAATQAEALLNRLKLYRLRAKVEISAVSTHQLYYVPQAPAHPALGFADPRAAGLPARLWAETPPASALPPEAYGTARFALCIPEGGVDITEGETALDAGLDMLGGVSFSKGCYVGQEITARMHYKDIIRKGFFRVQAAQDLPAAPADIALGGKTVAQLRSAQGATGIAYGRLEDAQAAIGAGNASIGALAVTLSTPDWQAEKWRKFHAPPPESA